MGRVGRAFPVALGTQAGSETRVGFGSQVGQNRGSAFDTAGGHTVDQAVWAEHQVQRTLLTDPRRAGSWQGWLAGALVVVDSILGVLRNQADVGA